MRNFIDLTGKQFGQLTVLNRDYDYIEQKKIKNKRPYWKCKCLCGNYITVNGNSLVSGTTTKCHDCSFAYLRKDITNHRFGKLVAIEPTKERGVDGSIKWKCQCDCGNITIVSLNNLNNNHTRSCGCLNSYGENLIQKILKENNITFEAQKTFPSCRFPDTNYLGYFDFYINNEFLLEFDGEQHFKTRENGHFNAKSVKAIQSRDEYKNQWCKNNNIPLKRIPYWAISKININTILDNTFLI